MTPGQNSGNAEVFIEVGPVKKCPFTKQYQIRSLFRSAVPQTWKPYQGHCYSTAINKVYDERIIVNAGFLGARFLNFKHRKTHSIAPAARLDYRSQV